MDVYVCLMVTKKIKRILSDFTNIHSTALIVCFVLFDSGRRFLDLHTCIYKYVKNIWF